MLAMMEPLMLASPVLVLDDGWSRGQLGPSHPFNVKTDMNTYILAKMFYEDYAGMYAKFADWHAKWFVPTYTKRFAEDLLYYVLDGYPLSTKRPSRRDTQPSTPRSPTTRS